MKTSAEVTRDKLRGGFYSPDALVDVCLDRVSELLGGRERVRVLEPAAGDGGFVRGLARHPLLGQVLDITAVEVVAEEAAKVTLAIASTGVSGRAVNASVLAPEVLTGSYDVAIGNPPFVRFQFVCESDRAHIDSFGRRLGVPFKGVSNLWIPVLLMALNNLRDGGVFSFIVPSECFTGLSARAVRQWLGDHASRLRVDLFPAKSFPGVLQEVVILSGEIARGAAHGAKVIVYDHATEDSWRHLLDEGAPTWTGLLLRPDHVDALNRALGSQGVRRFGEVAKLSVATVTGANDYFCLDDDTRTQFQLEGWTRPLLDRVRHAPGLDYTVNDHRANRAAGRPVWLLDSRQSSEPTAGAAAYVAVGEARALHTRYKTRSRAPWWRVPVVPPGSLLLSKRSNGFPRLFRNLVGVVTTDTIYQGSPLPSFNGRERDIVSSFHNSLTLLTAEMNGRSFGGGVLELVPSEISSLALPLGLSKNGLLGDLDRLVREHGADSDLLVAATDRVLVDQLGLDRDMWRLVSEARILLRDRRLARG